MVTIRKQFHDIANLLNIILISANCTKELLKDEPLVSLNEKQLELKQDTLIQMCNKLEEAVLQADKKTKELKDFIYNNINPDIELKV